MIKLTNDEKKIIQFLQKCTETDIPSMANKLKIDKKTIYRYCKKLEHSGVISMTGKRRHLKVALLMELDIIK